VFPVVSRGHRSTLIPYPKIWRKHQLYESDCTLKYAYVNTCLFVTVRPLWVRLQGGKRPLVAGQKTELVCQAVGARPKPSITWWRGGTKLKTVRETVSIYILIKIYRSSGKVNVRVVDAVLVYGHCMGTLSIWVKLREFFFIRFFLDREGKRGNGIPRTNNNEQLKKRDDDVISRCQKGCLGSVMEGLL
jgi:hypothetical protein